MLAKHGNPHADYLDADPDLIKSRLTGFLQTNKLTDRELLVKSDDL